MAGHLGADKTLGRLRDRFYWPGHYTHVQEWCRDCAVCASHKSPTPSQRRPLQPIATSRQGPNVLQNVPIILFCTAYYFYLLFPFLIPLFP